jgi:2-C-methyl-D-erythritol 4-phosphate cytidylyltransferase
METLDAIIVAAGASRRMGFDKMTADLAGRPVIARTIDAFERCAGVRHIHVVASEENHARFGALLQGFTKLRPLVFGGAHRHLSVWNGLNALDAAAEFVAVHDGARPLVTTGMIDTLKRADAAHHLAGSVERDGLWAMETPQTFSVPLLRRAYENVIAKNLVVTDETSAVELLGLPVALVAAEDWNFKITYPRDLALAAFALGSRRQE